MDFNFDSNDLRSFGQVSQGVEIVLRGDPGSGPTPTPAPAAITITLPTAVFDPSVASTTNITLPVTTTQMDPGPNPSPGDPGYIAFQGDFTFDSSVVTFQSPIVQPAGLTGANWNVSANIISSGPGTTKILRVSAFSLDSTPLSGSGTLYNLIFRRVSSISGNTSPLTWRPIPDDFELIDQELNAFSPSQNNGLITITGTGPTQRRLSLRQPQRRLSSRRPRHHPRRSVL